MNVRIAIVTESFPPDVNGVAHSTLRIAEHLVTRGHQPLVIAPAPAKSAPRAAGPFPCQVIRLRSVPVPRYRNFRVSAPGPGLRAAVAGHFHDQLGARGIPLGPRPVAEPTSPPPTRLDTAAWMATKGTAWVLRRCTDLVPYLLFMALRESWPGPGPQPQVLPPLSLPQPAAADPGPGPEAGMPQAGVPEIGVPEIGHAP